MKSSDAVFMRQNPFPPEPLLARIHYNPSRAKKISKQQKKLALSPVRFDRGISPEPPPQSSSSSLEDDRFLEESHCVVLCPPASVKGRQSFSECWPSTDPDSSCVNPGFFKEYQTSDQHTMTRGTQEPSVFAKYIERFRYGRPQSREERQRLEAAGEDEQPFWRTSTSHPSPSSSTPTQASKEQFRGSFDCKKDGHMHNPAGPNSLFPTKGLLDLSVLALSDSSHGDPGEPEIVQLQERASRLLQKSKNSLSSGSDEIPISSEGLGCSDFSSPVSADEPIRTPLVPFVMDTANLLTPSLSGDGPISSHSALGTRSHFRPEDDILFQWRLRRKMEQARQWSHTSSNSSSFHQPVLASVAQQPSPVSASAPHRTTFSFTPTPVEQTGPINSSVACTNHQPALTISAPSIQTHSDSITCGRLVPFPQPVEDKAALDPQKPCTLPQPHQKIQGSSSETSVEPCSKDQTPSLPSPQPSEGTEREWLTYQRREVRQAKGRAVVERDGKKTVPSTHKKTSDRHAGHGHGVESSQCVEKANGRHSRDQEKVSCKTKKSRQEKRWHSGGQNSTGDVGSGDCAPPPSPIHSTLGQVVSEVLFPDSDSPDQSRTPCSSYSSRGTPHSPPQSPTPPPPQSIPQPAELIGQLMQEAQDSDGLEFEDDPLLLVLRQQRKWVKEQLCEVDKMLEKLHED